MVASLAVAASLANEISTELGFSSGLETALNALHTAASDTLCRLTGGADDALPLPQAVRTKQTPKVIRSTNNFCTPHSLAPRSGQRTTSGYPRLPGSRQLVGPHDLTSQIGEVCSASRADLANLTGQIMRS